MKRTVFMIKHAYNKALNKLMSTADKIDFAVVNLDELIVKLGDARTSLVMCHDDANLAQISIIETRIRETYAKKQELQTKRQEYIAKQKALEAQLKAQLALSKVGLDASFNVDAIVAECDNDIAKLEAELDTAKFISLLA